MRVTILTVAALVVSLLWLALLLLTGFNAVTVSVGLGAAYTALH